VTNEFFTRPKPIATAARWRGGSISAKPGTGQSERDCPKCA